MKTIYKLGLKSRYCTFQETAMISGQVLLFVGIQICLSVGASVQVGVVSSCSSPDCVPNMVAGLIGKFEY